MKLVTVLLLCSAGLLSAPSPPQAGGWRGIVPLRSTRADVERLIGKPSVGRGAYDVEGDRVYILYTRDQCSGGLEGGYKVPPDTVVSINVMPRKGLRPSDLRFAPDSYKRLEDASDPAVASYRSEEDGVTYLVYEGGERDGELRLILYGPRADDAHLRCPEPAGQPGSEDGPRAQSDAGNTGPLGECPDISIEAPQGGASSGGEYTLSALIVGADPRFNPTLQWGVSAGRIVSGQGTSAVKIDTSGAGCDPVTVTLEVGGVIPRGCPGVKTYTIEHSKPR